MPARKHGRVLLYSLFALVLSTSFTITSKTDGVCGPDDSYSTDYGLPPFLSFPISGWTHKAAIDKNVITAMFDNTYPLGLPGDPTMGGIDDRVVVSDGNHAYKGCVAQDNEFVKPSSYELLRPHVNLARGWLWYDGHNAHDYGISGTAVAAAAGEVVFAGWAPCLGNTVIVEHHVPATSGGLPTEAYRTLYAHLASFSVLTGARVKVGQPLGVIGCTTDCGSCTGEHLHFAVFHLLFDDYAQEYKWYPTDPYGYPDAPYIDPLLDNDGKETSVWLWQDLTPFDYSIPVLDAAVNLGGSFTLGSQAIDSDVTISLEPGESATIVARLRNAGLAAWRSEGGYKLCRMEGDIGPDCIGVDQQVPSSEVYSWKIPVVGPSSPGAYSATWRMVVRGTAFGDEVRTTVVISDSTDGARATSGPFNISGDATDQARFQVRFLNTGSTTWASSHYQLKDEISGDVFQAPDTVPPGWEAIWDMVWQMPIPPGILEGRLRMYRDVSPFGDSVSVRLDSRPAPATDNAEPYNNVAEIFRTPAVLANFDIRFLNTGESNWWDSLGYKMVNETTGMIYPKSSGAVVGPGTWEKWDVLEPVSFAPGTYEWRFRMYHGDAGFGEPSVVRVHVVEPLVCDSSVVYEDHFSSSASGWSTSTGDVDRYYFGGQYVIAGSPNWTGWSYAPGAYVDYSVQTDIELPTGAVTGFGGIVAVASEDRTRLVTLELRSDLHPYGYVDAGYYRIRERLNDAFTVVKPWTESEAIDQGVNTLSASRRGSQIDLYINGEWVHSLSYDLPPGNSRVGLIAGTWSDQPEAATFRFDDFVVRWCGVGTPNSAPKAPSSPVPSDAQSGVAPVAVELSWSGGDPDVGDTITYDVYLAEEGYSQSKLCSGESLSCAATNLQPGTTYTWRVVARDGAGSESQSPLWSFVTREVPSPVITWPPAGSVFAMANDRIFISWTDTGSETRLGVLPPDGFAFSGDFGTGTMREFSLDEMPGEYCFRVQARIGDYLGTWSPYSCLVLRQVEPPSGDWVRLYDGRDYTAEYHPYEPGFTNEPAAQASSVYVPAGWSIRAWDQDSRVGDTVCWHGSVPSLASIGWDDRIESIEVYDYDVCDPNVPESDDWLIHIPILTN
ncbi:MAG: peptidoglycan DD-metalloendopeptidase family protein [Chloroflexi bacterium]|nr:peptidoglycan DD-metalloendopeptidase family protein [Chloroflexota bacterium]